MSKPIFVIGKNRSGTKWLSNILSRHPDVASVQRVGAGGILETNLFFTFPAVFGNLREKENYCAMAACYSKSNFFRCTGLDENVLFRNKIGDYFDFFQHIMCTYAEKEKKSHWLQKADSLILPQLHAAFPDAKFIIINREITANIRSSIALARLGGRKRTSILREMAQYHLGEKIYHQFKERPNVVFATFEDLKQDREKVIKSVCEFLHLDFYDRMLEDAFEKNTSFSKGIGREHILTQSDMRCINLLEPLFQMMPLALLKIFRRLFGSSRDPNGGKFITKSFSMLRKQHGWPDKD